MNRLGADRLTLLAPEGYETTGAVPNASTENGRLVMRSFDSPSSGPFVVFVPADDSRANVRAARTLSAILAPRIASNAIWFLLVPSVVLTASLAMQVSTYRKRGLSVPSQFVAVLSGTMAGAGVSLLESEAFSPDSVGLFFIAVGAGFLACGGILGVVTRRWTGTRPLVVLAVPGIILGAIVRNSLFVPADGSYPFEVVALVVVAVVISLLALPWFLFSEFVVPGEDW